MSERDRQDQESTSQINSEGGAVTQGDVNVGGNYTGRDSHQTTIINNYYGTENPDEKPADPWEQFNQLPLDQIPERGDLASVSFFRLQKNQTFVGRRDELQAIAKLIKEGDKTVAIAATGMGGIGKSQLAAEFCQRYGRYFAGGVFWLSFDSETSARTSLLESASHLNPAWGQLDAPSQIRNVLGTEGWKANVPRLLVFDNLEEPDLLEQYQPTVGGCRVLLTSRYGDWERSGQNVQPLPLETLPRPDSVQLLQTLALRLTVDEAEEIAAELGDFPLALHLAGCYLRQYRRTVTANDYLAQLRSPDLMAQLKAQAEKIERGNNANPTRHTWDVGRTFELSYAQIRPSVGVQRAGPDVGDESNQEQAQHAAPLQGDDDEQIKSAARRLLARAALLAPNEPIPLTLLFQTLDDEQQEFVEDGLNRLLQLGLAEEALFGEDAQPGLRLHRLTCAFATTSGELLDDDLPQLESATTSTISRINNDGYPLKLVPYRPHLQHLVERAADRQDTDLATLINNFAYHLEAMGDYPAALPLYQQSLDILKKQLGENHPHTATSLNNLALLHESMGDYPVALPLFQQSLNIRKKQLGENHPQTASSLNNLAALYKAMGDYPAALPLYQQSLDILKKQLGENHPHTATSLNNLATLYRATGDYPAALPLYQQSLDIRKKQLGENHPHTATSLNNLALLYQSMGDYSAALPLYQQSLDILKKQLGENHSDIATALNNLALLYQSMGDYPAAFPLYQQSLDIRKKQLGKNHPDTATALNNLAVLAYNMENYAEAETLMQQALTIRETTLGPDHPSTVSSHNSLAAIRAKLSGNS